MLQPALLADRCSVYTVYPCNYRRRESSREPYHLSHVRNLIAQGARDQFQLGYMLRYRLFAFDRSAEQATRCCLCAAFTTLGCYLAGGLAQTTHFSSPTLPG